MSPLQTITLKNACMINMRSVLWACAIFQLRDEAFGDVRFCERNMSFHSLVFLFQIEGKRASLKAVSHILFGNWCYFQT